MTTTTKTEYVADWIKRAHDAGATEITLHQNDGQDTVAGTWQMPPPEHHEPLAMAIFGRIVLPGLYVLKATSDDKTSPVTIQPCHIVRAQDAHTNGIAAPVGEPEPGPEAEAEPEETAPAPAAAALPPQILPLSRSHVIVGIACAGRMAAESAYLNDNDCNNIVGNAYSITETLEKTGIFQVPGAEDGAPSISPTEALFYVTMFGRAAIRKPFISQKVADDIVTSAKVIVSLLGKRGTFAGQHFEVQPDRPKPAPLPVPPGRMPAPGRGGPIGQPRPAPAAAPVPETRGSNRRAVSGSATPVAKPGSLLSKALGRATCPQCGAPYTRGHECQPRQ